jgi:hypothetical protein
VNLIHLYINEVTRRLPEKAQEDIALELRSNIEDMLPEDYTEEDVKKVLTKLGNPAELAQKYSGKPNYLIGPALYCSYLYVMKISLVAALCITFLTRFFEGIIQHQGDISIFSLMLTIFLDILIGSLLVSFQVFTWVTLTYAFMERAVTLSDHVKNTKWTPDDLLALTNAPKRTISRSESIFELFFTVLWASIFLNASNLLGWYTQHGTGLEDLKLAAPLFQADVLKMYLPGIAVIFALEMFIAIYKLYTGRWNKGLAWIHALSNLLFSSFYCIMLLNPELFNNDFISLTMNSFGVQPENHDKVWSNWLFASAAIVILFSIVDAAKGFRNSRKNVL